MNERKEHRRKVERRAPKEGVTIRHDDTVLPKRIRNAPRGLGYLVSSSIARQCVCGKCDLISLCRDGCPEYDNWVKKNKETNKNEDIFNDFGTSGY